MHTSFAPKTGLAVREAEAAIPDKLALAGHNSSTAAANTDTAAEEHSYFAAEHLPVAGRRLVSSLSAALGSCFADSGQSSNRQRNREYSSKCR